MLPIELSTKENIYILEIFKIEITMHMLGEISQSEKDKIACFLSYVESKVKKKLTYCKTEIVLRLGSSGWKFKRRGCGECD
jgi:hypothetical protein